MRKYARNAKLIIVQFLNTLNHLPTPWRGVRTAARKDTYCAFQRFHHPEYSCLVHSKHIQGHFEYCQDNRSKLHEEDDREDDGYLGLAVSELKRKTAEREMVWECWGSHYFSTCCISIYVINPEQATHAMEVNDGERSWSVRRYFWQGARSYGRDDPEYCTCGYADGFCVNCSCWRNAYLCVPCYTL